MKTKQPKPWFNASGWMLRKLPKQCVADCTAAGAVDDAVEYWQKKLGFTVPQERARKWLERFGAWEAEEIAAWSDEETAARCLWILAGNAKENKGEAFGLVE